MSDVEHPVAWENCRPGQLTALARNLRQTQLRRRLLRTAATTTVLASLLLGCLLTSIWLTPPPTYPLSCTQVIEWEPEYREGTLDATRRAQVDRHLAHCPACRDYYAESRRLAWNQLAHGFRLAGRTWLTPLLGVPAAPADRPSAGRGVSDGGPGFEFTGSPVSSS